MPPYAIPAPFIAALARAPVSRPGSGTRYGTWRFFGGRGGPSAAALMDAGSHSHSHSHSDGAGAAHSHSHGSHAHSQSHGDSPAWPPRPDAADPLASDSSHAPRNPTLDPGEGRGKCLFVDAYVAGVAGDMFVAALLDLGVPLSVIEASLTQLEEPWVSTGAPSAAGERENGKKNALTGYSIRVVADERSCIVAPRFVVHETSPQPLRNYAEISAMLRAAGLEPGVEAKALRAFALLAKGEGSVHGVPPADVHFHEVGAVDSIVDVVAVAAALDYLACDEIVVSSLPMGRGILCGAAHGPLPLPPPATTACLCSAPFAIETHNPGVEGEFVTPTGACLIAAFGNRCENWPGGFAPERCAYGAGTKRWADRPNLLRLVLGTRGEKNRSQSGGRASTAVDARDVISGDGETTD